MNSTESCRVKARNSGHHAYLDGAEKSSNPFEAGTDRHCQWDIGFENAQHDPKHDYTRRLAQERRQIDRLVLNSPHGKLQQTMAGSSWMMHGALA